MADATGEKIEKVGNLIAGYGSVLVALSGGVDSSLLLSLAARTLPGRVKAAFARSVLNPPGEYEAARATAAGMGVDLIVLDFDPLAIEAVRYNALDRCYHCKKGLARRLLAQAEDLGLLSVLEGSHGDDAFSYRPGARALLESGMKSPLKEAGLTKTEIRQTAQALGLAMWNKPPGACLATRFPYETVLTPDNLDQVRRAEILLAAEGLIGARARHHGDILRLELPPQFLPRLAEEPLRARLLETLTGLGFRFITADLAGYRPGVFDQAPAGMEDG
ncbi:MAG: ATP-dependent sacrificial sulfur transferase LarE [Thermodesulfobacteriota bacterium]